MSKITTTVTLALFGFILRIIYLANTGQHSISFSLVKAVPHGDKIGHFCLFGLLTLGCNLALRCRTFRVQRFQIYIGTFFVTLFVIAEEISQFLLPTRTLDIIDLAADFIGILSFTEISFYLDRRRMFVLAHANK